MKKEIKIPLWILFIWFIMDAASRFDGTLSILERIGVTEKDVTKTMEIIRQIFGIGTTLIILWLIWVLYKALKKIENQNSTIKEQNSKIEDLKIKVIALKLFRDTEMLRVINHYNAQLHDIDLRIELINGKNKFFKGADYIDANAEKNFTENEQHKEKDLIAYNNTFKEWQIGNYGEGTNSSIYKKKDFKE